MIYKPLSLNYGGGINNPAARSPQFSGSAALCIGIGGTGVAALSELKGKIYQQMIPDNPGESVPRYDAIQLLGIDSDDREYRNYSGNHRLDRTEFFSVRQCNIVETFNSPQGKRLIKNDPRMNWLEIDNIRAPLSPEGSGGIRQIGRYLLLSKADSLYTEISNKCRLALMNRRGKPLDIYIFAGLSGGTGSGCFVDTCYLVRKVVDDYGLDARIMGYFFLPDVVTGKMPVFYNPAAVAYNNSNGYAALKELDYLMHLEKNGDEFIQDYGFGNILRTKQPPVDVCYLISARKADGSLVADDFNYSINVVSDYVVTFLADTVIFEDDSAKFGLTIPAYLSGIARRPPRCWDANSYHILGICKAEVPMTQFNTYLATGFFQKFAKGVCIPRSKVNKEAVQRLMSELQVDATGVCSAVVSNTRKLHLPEIDRKQLAREPVCARGTLPRIWADSYNNWLAECDGIMAINSNGLTKKLDGFGYHEVNVQSLIGRLFRRLWDLSVDPAYGPYYAAYLLKNNGDDLVSALDGEIAKVYSQEDEKRIQLHHMEDLVIECNEKLVNGSIFSKKRAYEDYYHVVNDYLETVMDACQCRRTAEVLRVFRTQAEELYNTFFAPLIQMLDNLQETFRDNECYFNMGLARLSHLNTHHMASLNDIKPRLDRALGVLHTDQLVAAFMQEIMVHSENWLKNDELQLATQISNYILSIFHAENSRSLQDYLFEKHPEFQGDPYMLSHFVHHEILKQLYDFASPMLWCDPAYLSDSDHVYDCSAVYTPEDCPAICSEASVFANSKNGCYAHSSPLERIMAIREISGVPLCAYLGIRGLKQDYDNAILRKASGAGIHLYADTGRGNCRNWRTCIPDPAPGDS